MVVPVLETERLVLREWRDADLGPFAELNADPVVMEHFPALITRAQSDEMARRVTRRWDAGGPSLWAVERRDISTFIGFVGLLAPTFEAHFTPCVEVGWRLAAPHWGRGFAPEGAAAAISWGFTAMELDEVVSFTSERNRASRRVMAKLGMHRDPVDDFDHPNIPSDHRLCRHVLYRVTRSEWAQRPDPFDGAVTHG